MSFVTMNEWIDVLEIERLQKLLDHQTLLLYTDITKLGKEADPIKWRNELGNKILKLYGYEIEEEENEDFFEVIGKAQKRMIQEDQREDEL